MNGKAHLWLIIFAAHSIDSYRFPVPNNRYCEGERCPPGIHTMCVYQDSAPSRECNRIIRLGLNREEIARIVDVHNELRINVYSGNEERGDPGPQPAAVRNASLEWDIELGIIAQRWANQCKLYGDVCRNVDRFYVGQNCIYKNFDEELDDETQLEKLEQLIQSWYDEVQDFDRNLVRSYRTVIDEVGLPIAEDYTQMVWANTTKIGCGAIRFAKESNPTPQIFLVCNYGPSGNDFDQLVYQEIRE